MAVRQYLQTVEMGVGMCAFGGVRTCPVPFSEKPPGLSFVLSNLLKAKQHANQISLTRSSLAKLKQTGRNQSQLAMNSRQARLQSCHTGSGIP